jgi:hypothetical protein
MLLKQADPSNAGRGVECPVRAEVQGVDPETERCFGLLGDHYAIDPW